MLGTRSAAKRAAPALRITQSRTGLARRPAPSACAPRWPRRPRRRAPPEGGGRSPGGRGRWRLLDHVPVDDPGVGGAWSISSSVPPGPEKTIARRRPRRLITPASWQPARRTACRSADGARRQGWPSAHDVEGGADAQLAAHRSDMAHAGVVDGASMKPIPAASMQRRTPRGGARWPRRGPRARRRCRSARTGRGCRAGNGATGSGHHQGRRGRDVEGPARSPPVPQVSTAGDGRTTGARGGASTPPSRSAPRRSRP